MKTKAKKILLGLGLALLGSFSTKAQGLEGIIVEKYYQTNAADAAWAAGNSAVSALNPGSIVYRVYVDMAPGYKYNLAFGNAGHDWKITTTTNFYNDPNNGVAVGPQGTSLNNTRAGTQQIDSWLTTGGVCSGKAGTLKIEDTDGAISNTSGILTNTLGGIFGAAINSLVPGPTGGLNARDGLLPSSALTSIIPTQLGLGSAADVFDQTAGNQFLVNAGSIAALGGIVGTTTTNAVLIGQFTTDGVLGFELNIQIQNTVTGLPETYVAKNPTGSEILFPSLLLAPPTVSITSPANGANFVTGSTVSITAVAAASGTVTQVEFKVDGVTVGTDLLAPFAATYAATAGTHTLTAIATDNTSLTATSAAVTITAANNQSPTVVVSPVVGAIIGQVITFTANATDVDGTISSATFSVDNVAIGTVVGAGPVFTHTWLAVGGPHNVKASAVDNLNAVGVSAPVAFVVNANIPPVVVITAPSNNSSVIAPQVVTITANANDPDGIVTSVEAFVNNISIGTFTTAGPSFTWTYASSTVTSVDVIKVVAIDNAAGTTTSTPVSINIIDPNALDYAIGKVSQQCNQGNFCLPISAAATYTVDNVIGYDFILYYDAAKVTPTGSVTVNQAMIVPTPTNANYVTVINSFASGTMNISAYFNANAPGNTEFNGTGQIFCVEFNKNTMSATGIDTAKFTVLGIDESYFIGVSTNTASAGYYNIYRDTTFNASVRFWNGGGPLAYNPANSNDFLVTNITGNNFTVCPTFTNVTSVQTNTLGNFVYNILNGNQINISRDILPGTDVQPVINGMDWSIGQGVVLNSTVVPSVYQMIALDVNLDGKVSSGDLTQMNQRTVLSIPEFKQAWNYNAAGTNTTLPLQPSKDWRFIDSVTVQTNTAYVVSNTYPLAGSNGGYSKFNVPYPPFCLTVPQTSLTNCPTINDEVYRAILLGDANGNWYSVLGVLGSSLQVRPNGDKVVIDLSKSVVNGNTVEVPVSFVSSTPVLALDFSMKFDQSKLTYNAMVNYPSVTNALAYLNPNDKKLRFTAANTNLEAFGANQPVAYIRFEANDSEITEEQFNSLAGYLNGDAVEVQVLSKTVGINSLSGGNSVSVYPNPTSGILNITSISDATVELFDVTGKVTLIQTTVNASKTKSIDVSELANGVYFAKIYNNDFVTIKKVVLSK